MHSSNSSSNSQQPIVNIQMQSSSSSSDSQQPIVNIQMQSSSSSSDSQQPIVHKNTSNQYLSEKELIQYSSLESRHIEQLSCIRQINKTGKKKTSENVSFTL